MTYKWIGAVLIIVGCSGFGFTLASVHRKTEKYLYQMLQVLEDMECLLQYKLMPLPELCRSSVRKIRGPVRMLMLQFSEELEQQIAPDAPSCMSAVLAKSQGISGNLRHLFLELGHNLGVYDLSGQLQGLENMKNNCKIVLKNLECNREVRIRSYQTLGICAGIALAIMLI